MSEQPVEGQPAVNDEVEQVEGGEEQTTAEAAEGGADGEGGGDDA